VRGLLWILGIALLGGAALLFAWRLVPTEVREVAQPAAGEPGTVSTPVAPLRAPVEPSAVDPRSEPEALEPASSAPPPPPPPVKGLEEGGLAQAARPLPDFSAKYASRLRSDWWLAAGELEKSIAAGRKQLTLEESADLEARLANAAREAEPSAKVAALLAQIDELAWLRQQLAQPREQQP
jgi:hypothetical protein